MNAKVVAALVVSLITAGWLHAAPRFAGPVRYDFVNQQAQVALSAALIQNNSEENATGTLQLQLWATAEPYTSGTIRGTLLGSAKLEGLAAGQYYKDYRKTVAYSPPKARASYFVTMALLEYREGQYVIVHHVNFDAKASLGPLPLFTMEGPWRYQASNEGGTVEMQVAKISHRRTGNTGSLKLAVWLTKAPYRGGQLHGWEIGQVRKDPLKPGFVYNDVKNVAKYVRPPAGDYYGSLVLFESDGQEFKVMAWLTTSEAAHFSAPPQ
jgi:hypothetical protein